MTEDVVPVAVLNARAIATRLVNTQKLKSLYFNEVAALRDGAIRTTVNALWRRYIEYKERTKTNPSFAEWLVECKHLERTFWKSNGLAVRRDWSFQYFNFLTRKELTLADDPLNMWMLDALEEAIDAKHDDPDSIIMVQVVVRKGLPQSHLKEGESLMFSKLGRRELDIEP